MDIFRDPTKTIPRGNDSQIIRVPMDQLDISGRKDHLPPANGSNATSVVHIPNKG